jgi:SpoVK/Ycf46/Vps4 family AAA+-type ATPase
VDSGVLVWVHVTESWPAAAPTVIFFDEVDALAGKRGQGDDSRASERVLSQLLTGGEFGSCTEP